jgi:hypothetical protein
MYDSDDDPMFELNFDLLLFEPVTVQCVSPKKRAPRGTSPESASHPDDHFNFSDCEFWKMLPQFGIKGGLKATEVMSVGTAIEKGIRYNGQKPVQVRERPAKRRKPAGMAWINRNFHLLSTGTLQEILANVLAKRTQNSNK